MSYIIPEIDNVLLNNGFIRCNEGLVYLKMINSGFHNGYRYMISYPVSSILLTDAEKLFGYSIAYNNGIQIILKSILKMGSVTYLKTDKYLYNAILQTTVDFYNNENDLVNYNKYKRFFELVTGKKYTEWGV